MRTAARAGTAALLATALAGCGTVSAQTAPGRDGRLDVAAAFYPLQFVAERVGGDRVDVTNLTKPGAEPHDLELTPRQVGAGRATPTLVVYLSGLPAGRRRGGRARRRRPGQADADRLVGSPPARPGAGGTTTAPTTAGRRCRGGTAGTRTSGSTRPGWPPSATALADALGEVDPATRPATAPTRRTSPRRPRPRSTRSTGRGLRTCRRREIVTSHAAFGYLAERYGPAPGRGHRARPRVEPSPQRLAEVRRRGPAARGVTTIFFETLVSPKVAETIAHEVGARTAVLDPIEGLAPTREPATTCR